MAMLRRERPRHRFSARAFVEGPCRGATSSVSRSRARSPGRPADRRVPNPPHHRTAARLVQHRGSTRRLQLAAAQARGAPHLTGGRTAPWHGRWRAGAGQLAAWICGGADSLRRVAASWPCFHDPAFPRPGGHQHPDHRRHRSQVRHRRVQGERDPDRQASTSARPLVDIRTTGGPPTAEEITAVDGFLGPAESLWEGGSRVAQDEHLAYGGRAARERRHLLLPVLHALQDRVGWVSRGALEYACRRLAVPPADAYGVASFYARFALERRPPLAVHVCDDIACKCAGADEL